MYNLFLSTLFLLFTTVAFCQWNPTNGPGGGTINDFYETNETIFTSTGNFGVGGVYSSDDGGHNWEITNKGLPLTSKVNAIYGDDEYLYAGLHLSGIYRSDDMGETWTASNNGISDYSLSILSLYEGGGVVYAGTFGGGIYVSTDHGSNWTANSNGLEGAAKRVAAITKLNSTLFIATPLGVYSSTDEGDNWISSSNGIPSDKVYSFDIVKKDNLLFVAALNGVYRSEDNGANWIQVGTEIFNQGVYAIEVFENNIYVGTNGKMYHSTDDGDNWIKIGTGIADYAYIYAVHANSGGLICGVNMRGIFKYNPDEDLWAQSNDGLINENVMDMMVDGDDLFAVTLRADFGQIFKSDNNGVRWMMSNDGAWDGGYHALMNTGGHYFAGTDGNFLYRSSDKGQNWENINYPEFPSSYISSFCEQEDVLFASTFGNTIDVYRSDDDGSNWAACSLPGQGNVMALVSTSEFVFAGRSDGVFRSGDLGLSWTQTSNGMIDFPFIKKLEYNENYLFAVANDGLYRSPDNGENWEKVYNPPTYNYIESIATNADYLFIGTKEAGLMISEDNGESWETSYPDFFQDPEGLIPTVMAIEIKGDSLYAAYKDFSIWVRTLPNITSNDELASSNDVENKQLLIYPNPVKDISTITYSLHISETVSIYVYDIFGKERLNLKHENQNSGKHEAQINVSELENGIYFLLLKAGNSIQQRRLVVTN